MKIIGERLKQLREEAGFSQNKLAKLIGIQQSSLNRYESGFSNPTPETPLTAPLVLEAYKRYDKGATMKEIRDWMNEQGFRNSRGNPISYTGVEHILSNRRYIGEYRYRDIVIPDGIPKIVPQDLFDRVQTRLAKIKRLPPGSKQRMSIYSQESYSVDTAVRRWSVKAGRVETVSTIITNDLRSSES